MSEASIGFIILAHTDPTHLERLIEALPRASMKTIHLDRKSLSLNGFATSVVNTQFVTPNLETHWGAFSLVQATIAALKTALSTTSAERFVLLSGQCYPLKSNYEMVSFFKKYPDKEFIKYFDITNSSEHYTQKLNRLYLSEDYFSALLQGRFSLAKIASRLSSRAAQPFRRNWSKSLGQLTPAYGSQWWAITRPCAEMIIEASKDPKLQFFQYTFAPDELYFHTIVANSSFHALAGGFQPFIGRGNRWVANLHLIRTSSLRKVFTLEDWDEVAKSDKLFLRKVNSTESNGLLAKIDLELRRSRG
jgi:hypothetical protein